MFNATFPKEDFSSFSDYITIIKNSIYDSCTNLNRIEATKKVEANSPFEMRPDNYDGENAILLVHGLLDSPFTMRDLGKYFLSCGFLVRAILLPGHGTVPTDLLNSNEQEWIKASQFGINSFRTEARKIYYLGFSTGASLGMYHGLSGNALAGLILIAPAIQLKPSIRCFTFFFNWIDCLFKRQKWILKKTNNNFTKYESYPIKVANDLNQLNQKIKYLSVEKQICCPLFMVLSDDDETIDSKAALRFFKTQKNSNNRLIYYSTHSVTFQDLRIELIKSLYPKQKIISFSHISLPIAPGNSYFGEQGAYKDIVYHHGYYQKNSLYKGALNYKNIKYAKFQRLSYNPDFENMMKKIKTWCFSISQHVKKTV